MNRQKVTALRKLTRARNFIVITDDEALLNIDMGKVDDINRTITLAQQRSMLDHFRRKLNDAIKQFDRKLTKSTTKKGKKIPVTEG